MKNTFTLCFLFIFSTTLFAQEIITKEVGDFNELKVFDLIKVTLIQADENKVVIKGEDTQDVQVINKNGLLKIRMQTDKSFQGEATYVEVHFKTLDLIDANEGSYIVGNEMIIQPQIRLRAQEGATIKVGLETTNLEARSVSGGIIITSGISQIQELTLNTGGIYEGRDLETQETAISITAAGEAEIHASKKADIRITAGGDVDVYGNPDVINEKRLAGGRIRRMN